MSNVKKVVIEGYMPFDVGGNDDVLRFLGSINLPFNGLNILWKKDKEFYKENEFNGKTCFVPFTIFGDEAISAEYLRHMIGFMNKVGKIEKACYYDKEIGNSVVDLLK